MVIGRQEGSESVYTVLGGRGKHGHKEDVGTSVSARS